MARPKVPLISRRKALEAALVIVDAEGLDALSIRRLGEALNVNGASLYHHFMNKDDILVGVTQLVLADVTSPPRTETESWRVWLRLNAYRTRQALVSHPEVIPIMLRRAQLGIGTAEIAASVVRLESEGVPVAMILPLMESLELLAITSALQEVGAGDAEGRYEGTPGLRAAQQARGLSGEEVFDIVSSSMISEIESAIHLKDARRETQVRTTPPVGGKGTLAKPTAAKTAAATTSSKTAASKTAASKTAASKPGAAKTGGGKTAPRAPRTKRPVS